MTAVPDVVNPVCAKADICPFGEELESGRESIGPKKNLRRSSQQSSIGDSSEFLDERYSTHWQKDVAVEKIVTAEGTMPRESEYVAEVSFSHCSTPASIFFRTARATELYSDLMVF